MQLSNNAASAFFPLYQLRPERALVRTFAQTEQTDEDVPFRVFVRQESLPASVGGVVPAEQLDRLRADLMMNLVDL